MRGKMYKRSLILQVRITLSSVHDYGELSLQQAEGPSTCRARGAVKKDHSGYDNICHVDCLKAAAKDLPLPPPFDKAWSLVKKV